MKNHKNNFIQEKYSKLIPREILCSNHNKTWVSISHDGKHVSFIDNDYNENNIYMFNYNHKTFRNITSNLKGNINFYFWMYTNRHILIFKDHNGDEKFDIFSLDIENKKENKLIPFKDIQPYILKLSYKHPTKMLVGVNKREPKVHDVYLVDIEKNNAELVFKNHKFFPLIYDLDFKLQYGFYKNSEGKWEVYSFNDKNEYSLILMMSFEDSFYTLPEGIVEESKELLLRSSYFSDTTALLKLNKNGDIRTAINPKEMDIGEIIYKPQNNEIQAVSYYYKCKNWEIIDEKVVEDFDILLNYCHGEMEIIDKSLDDNVWLICYDDVSGPKRYYKYNRYYKTMDFLFVDNIYLENKKEELSKMYSVSIKSKDNYELISYYTIPKNGKRPFPAIVLVHGGPWIRDKYCYNYRHQWLANRGYFVISINFRGSSGFGKSFINASINEWGGKMQEDLVDGTKWAIENRLADPDNIGILGSSYGGYAALMGLILNSNIFKCAVSLGGPLNLETVFENYPEYLKSHTDTLKKHIGDNKKNELIKKSPVHNFNKINSPLFLVFGENDIRANLKDAEIIVKKLNSKGLPLVYLIYANEGHSIKNKANRLSLHALIEKFLSIHLGGKIEPINDELIKKANFKKMLGVESFFKEK